MEKKKVDSKSFYVAFQLGKFLFASNMCNTTAFLDNYNLIQNESAKDCGVGAIMHNSICIPVIDMQKKMNIPASRKSGGSIIMAEINYGKDFICIGLLVDSIECVIEVIENKIVPSGRKFAHTDLHCIKGEVLVEENSISIINFSKLFNIKELNQLRIAQLFLS